MKVEPEPMVTVSEAQAQGIWDISNLNTPNNKISVHVVVASAMAEDGTFDTKESAAIVRDHVHRVVTSTQRDGIWKPHKLDGFGISLQYVDDLKAGRVVITGGNVSSSAVLEPYALELLKKTRRNGTDPKFPKVQRQAIVTSTTTLEGPEANTQVITVKRIDPRFSVVLSVDCEIAVADGSSNGTGVLLEIYKLGSRKDGEARTVEFFFVPRKVGEHREVHMYVVDKETMVQAMSVLKVNVDE
jgi:hypothetical protein